MQLGSSDAPAQTVRELERKGELRAMRTDAGWRLFHRDDVLRFVEERARRRDRAERIVRVSRKSAFQLSSPRHIYAGHR